MATKVSTSIKVGNQSWVFYTTKSGDALRLRLKISKIIDESQNPPYESKTIELDHKPVSVDKDTTIASVSWPHDGGHQVRVYYSNGYKLQELVGDQSASSWAEGQLGLKGFKIAPDSGLTADIQGDWLKVYGVNNNNTDTYTVFYDKLGAGHPDWNSRQIDMS